MFRFKGGNRKRIYRPNEIDAAARVQRVRRDRVPAYIVHVRTNAFDYSVNTKIVDLRYAKKKKFGYFSNEFFRAVA